MAPADLESIEFGNQVSSPASLKKGLKDLERFTTLNNDKPLFELETVKHFTIVDPAPTDIANRNSDTSGLTVSHLQRQNSLQTIHPNVSWDYI